MLFNSWQFLLFFPLVTAVYFGLPHRARWGWLLLASCWFYMAFVPAYIGILAITITVDYLAGLLIAGSQGRTRRAWLMASVFANVGMLALFKYYDFFTANMQALAAALDLHYPLHALGLLLPIGLSFHTFQSLSYTIEVYRGRQAPERHPGIFALYVLFYPQLVAGPIERPQNLLHQFREVHAFDPARVTAGLRRMAWGLFRKVVIADRIAAVIDPLFQHPAQYPGPVLALAALLFAYQIYSDFAGYSDIALGSAQVMGFTLMENFDRPYAAGSVAEFWTRWHRSLSTWFRDYVYIPLGGNRVSNRRWAFNVMVVFLVSGLWHGANWTFLVWGGLHGLAMWVERASHQLRRHWPPLLGWALTMGVVVVAWIFFRAPTVADAWTMVSRLPTGWVAGWHGLSHAAGLSRADAIILLTGIALVEGVHYAQAHRAATPWFDGLPRWQRWAAYQALVLSIAVLGAYNAHAFIYFQF